MLGSGCGINYYELNEDESMIRVSQSDRTLIGKPDNNEDDQDTDLDDLTEKQEFEDQYALTCHEK